MISGISTPSGLMINGESSSNGLTVSHMRSGLWIITDEEIAMVENEFAPVTPGEMLKEEFLAEYELSQNQLAKAVGISPNRITEIVNNRRRITETRLSASDYTSVTARSSG